MVNIQYQISAQANFIAGELLEYAQTLAGDCQVVFSPEELWMQSCQISQRPMFYVCYLGESPWSSNDNISACTHRVSRNWCVRVKQGRGVAAKRGSTLSTPVGNAGLFYNVVEHTRDLCRAMLGITEDTLIDYQGIKPVRLGDQYIDCFDILWSTKNDLPTIVSTPDE